jgi:hypothetical protein
LRAGAHPGESLLGLVGNQPIIELPIIVDHSCPWLLWRCRAPSPGGFLSLRSEAVEGGSDALPGLVGDGAQVLAFRDSDHDLRVECLHQGPSVAGSTNDDVARQQQPDLAIQVQGPMR